MIDQPNNSITFGKEIIRLDKEGFHYRDQFIADAGEAHRLMVEFLRQNTQPEPQGPTDEELMQLLFDDYRGVIEFVCDVEEEAHVMADSHVKFARAVLARWGCQ